MRMFNLKFLDNLKITSKLLALFSAVLVGFVVLGITYWLENKVTSDAADRSSAFIQYQGLVNKAQTNYLKVRRYETDFSLSISGSTGQTYNDAPLENHQKHMGALESAMSELINSSAQIDEYTQKIVYIDS